ncbi:MAG: PKD domain-containing protein [Methanoregula sp.]
MTHLHKIAVTVILAGILLLAMIGPVSATTYSYTNATLTSSAAFQAAINATTDGDTIALAPGIYWINKTLLVFNDTTIQSDGGTAQNTILDGVTPWGQSPADGIFRGSYDVNLNKKTFTMKNLTLRNSQSTNAQGGGGVNVYGNLTVISSDFYNVSTDSNRKGGALACVSGNGINLTVIGSNFTWCSARQGGAIYSQNSFVNVNSSSFVSCSAGVATGGGAIYSNGGGNFTFNRFGNITAPDGIIIRNNGGGGDLMAIENWWGTNTPTASMFSGTVNYNPYLVLGVNATPSTITTSQTSAILANLSYDNTGVKPAGNILPDGIPVYFTIGSGTGSVLSAMVMTANHFAATTFTPAGGGTTMVNASADSYNQSVLVSVPIPIIQFYGTPTSGTKPVTVIFNDTSTGTPSPTTWNWSFGDGTWFNTTDVLAKNVSHTYTVSASYNIGLTANNTYGANTSTLNGYIVVYNPSPPSPGTGDDGGGGPAKPSAVNPAVVVIPPVVVVPPIANAPAKTDIVQPGPTENPVTGSPTLAPAVTISSPATGLHLPDIINMILPAIREYQFWLILIIIIIIAIAILRRWWIRRQNPALFRKYD